MNNNRIPNHNLSNIPTSSMNQPSIGPFMMGSNASNNSSVAGNNYPYLFNNNNNNHSKSPLNLRLHNNNINPSLNIINQQKNKNGSFRLSNNNTNQVISQNKNKNQEYYIKTQNSNINSNNLDEIFQTTQAKVTHQYWRQDQINSNIQNLDSINRKLLSIADNISKTSFMQNKKVPTIIVQLQNDLRTILTQLIANVKEFFIDIDGKLRNVVQSLDKMNLNNIEGNKNNHNNNHIYSIPLKGNIINPNTNSFNSVNSINSNNSSKTNPNQRFHQDNYRQTMRSQQAKYALLSTKVQALQVSLKRTQSNQEKLMEVISSLMDKYKINQQPTIIRQDPNLSNHFNLKQQKYSTSTGKKQFSIHEKLYHPHLITNPDYMESQVTQTLMPKSLITDDLQQNYQNDHIDQRQKTQPQQFIRKIYAKNQMTGHTTGINSIKAQNLNNQYNKLEYPLNKKSLKSTSTLEIMQKNVMPGKNEDKSHRMTFMMNNLKKD